VRFKTSHLTHGILQTNKWVHHHDHECLAMMPAFVAVGEAEEDMRNTHTSIFQRQAIIISKRENETNTKQA
jgi:hypothetical protein